MRGSGYVGLKNTDLAGYATRIQLISFCARLKADLSLPRGIGEKLVLRLAAWNLGLLKTSR